MWDPYQVGAIQKGDSKRLTLCMEKGYILTFVLIKKKGKLRPAVWRGRVCYQGLKRLRMAIRTVNQIELKGETGIYSR